MVTHTRAGCTRARSAAQVAAAGGAVRQGGRGSNRPRRLKPDQPLPPLLHVTHLQLYKCRRCAKLMSYVQARTSPLMFLVYSYVNVPLVSSVSCEVSNMKTPLSFLKAPHLNIIMSDA